MGLVSAESYAHMAPLKRAAACSFEEEAVDQRHGCLNRLVRAWHASYPHVTEFPSLSCEHIQREAGISCDNSR
jgi:hypothetical protein